MLEAPFETSKALVIKLGCKGEYYDSSDLFWFEKDPEAVFNVRSDGSIIIRTIFAEKQLSIYALWKFFSKEQKKLIIFNLDKFK